MNGTKGSSFGGNLGRKPYQEIDEVELTRVERAPRTPPEDQSTRSDRSDGGILKAVTIHQTLG